MNLNLNLNLNQASTEVAMSTQPQENPRLNPGMVRLMDFALKTQVGLHGNDPAAVKQWIQDGLEHGGGRAKLMELAMPKTPNHVDESALRTAGMGEQASKVAWETYQLLRGEASGAQGSSPQMTVPEAWRTLFRTYMEGLYNGGNTGGLEAITTLQRQVSTSDANTPSLRREPQPGGLASNESTPFSAPPNTYPLGKQRVLEGTEIPLSTVFGVDEHGVKRTANLGRVTTTDWESVYYLEGQTTRVLLTNAQGEPFKGDPLAAERRAQEVMKYGGLTQLAADPRENGQMAGVFVGRTFDYTPLDLTMAGKRLPPEMLKGVDPKLLVYFPESGVVFGAAFSNIPMKGNNLYPVYTFNVKDPQQSLQVGLGQGGPIPGMPGHNYFVNLRANQYETQAVIANAMTDPSKVHVLGTANVGVITGSNCPPSVKQPVLPEGMSDSLRAGVGAQVQLGMQNGELIVRSPNGWLPLKSVMAGLAVLGASSELTRAECREKPAYAYAPDTQQIQSFLRATQNAVVNGVAMTAAGAAAILEFCNQLRMQ